MVLRPSGEGRDDVEVQDVEWIAKVDGVGELMGFNVRIRNL